MKKIFALALLITLLAPIMKVEALTYTPSISSASTPSISISKPTGYETTFRVNGKNLDTVLFNKTVNFYLDGVRSKKVWGDAKAVNVNFAINANQLKEGRYKLIIKVDKSDSYWYGKSKSGVLGSSNVYIQVFNPYNRGTSSPGGIGTPGKNIRFELSQINKDIPDKNTIGLNVHWALGGIAQDQLYEQRLKESNTKWVREQFQMDALTGPNRDAWLARYDKIIAKYSAMRINVVGMLAYGRWPNEKARPDLTQWAAFVKDIVSRYGYHVKVWEIWNEPDRGEFLINPSVDNYVPLLKTGHATIKSVDPGTIVLNGPVSWPNTEYLNELYLKAGFSFDSLAFHVYRCNEWKAGDKTFVGLERDLARVKALIDRYRPGQHAWVTEVGCSTGVSRISETDSRQYLSSVAPYLIRKDWIDNVMLFNFKDRTHLNPYENNFGLLNPLLQPKQQWQWYSMLPPTGKVGASLLRALGFSHLISVK